MAKGKRDVKVNHTCLELRASRPIAGILSGVEAFDLHYLIPFLKIRVLTTYTPI